MKNRAFVMILILMLSMMLSSCRDDGPQPNSPAYSDDYLYTYIDTTLYRISPYSESISPVCPDPLCSHNTQDCPFYACEEFDFSGEYVYYLRDGNRKSESLWGGCDRLCRYSLSSGKYEELYLADKGTLVRLAVFDDKIYFTLNISEYDDGNFSMKYIPFLYEITSGKVTQLLEKEADEQYSEPITAYAFENGRVYWNGNHENFSTDPYFRDKRTGDRSVSKNRMMGDYSYRLNNPGKIYKDEYVALPMLELYYTDKKTGKETLIFPDLTVMPILYADKIIYSKVDPLYMGNEIDGETGKPKAAYSANGNKYYICDADGSNEKLLCTLPTDCAVPLTSGLIAGKNGVGDWIAIRVYNWEHYSDESGADLVRRCENRWMLINIQTGEVKEAVR